MAVERVKLTGSAVTGIDLSHYAKSCEAAGEPLSTEVSLGCVFPKAQSPCLRLSNYIKVGYTLPTLPVDWASKAMASLNRVYLNSQYGCCVISDAFHRVGIWTANKTGVATVGLDSEVLQTYRIWNPGNQDNGCQIDLVLDYCRDHGIPLNGVLHRIDGYVAIDWTNWDEILVALYCFGALPMGFYLPQAWLNSDTWDVTNSPIVGGHDVPAVARLVAGKVRIASWGRLYDMTQAAVTSRRYVQQMYAPLSPDWYGSDGMAPNFIAVNDLRSDLAKLGGGVIPDIEPPPPSPIPMSNNREHFFLNVPKGSWPTFVRSKSGAYTKLSTLNVTDPLIKDKVYPLGAALGSGDDPTDDPFGSQEGFEEGWDQANPQDDMASATDLMKSAPPVGAGLWQYALWIEQQFRQHVPKAVLLLAVQQLPIKDRWKRILTEAVEILYMGS